MGIYLATPNTEINYDLGSGAGVEFAVAEMQGWRRHMEDAHIATPGFVDDPNAPISIFGVFDGHGGKEVSKFVKLKYLEVLKSLPAFQRGQYQEAIRQSFHRIDELLEDEQFDALLKEFRALPSPSEAAADRQKGFRRSPIPPATPPTPVLYGNTKANATVTTTPAVTTTVTTIPTPTPKETGKDDEDDKDEEEDDETELTDDSELTTEEAVKMLRELLNAKKTNKKKGEGVAPPSLLTPEETPSSSSSAQGEDNGSSHEDAVDAAELEFSTLSIKVHKPHPQRTLDLDTNNTNSEDNTNIVLAHNTNCKEADHTASPFVEDPSQCTALVIVPNSSSEEDEEETKPKELLPPPPAVVKNVVDKSNHPPSITTITGQVMCNLKDHRVLAGCTAIVAMLIGKTIIVANAGDSRGTLYRRGKAIALSEDHKPLQDRELNRIKTAGGFVNFAGRVNGNLNLSRSLGDLKYKQLKYLRPEDQMITAEPDIVTMDITEDDEFFILACDGIWDCLTNQQACDFVKTRLMQHKSLQTITEEVLSYCLAEDPRKSQGIGGDNMTFMVVALKPLDQLATATYAEEDVNTNTVEEQSTISTESEASVGNSDSKEGKDSE